MLHNHCTTCHSQFDQWSSGIFGDSVNRRSLAINLVYIGLRCSSRDHENAKHHIFPSRPELPPFSTRQFPSSSTFTLDLKISPSSTSICNSEDMFPPLLFAVLCGAVVPRASAAINATCYSPNGLVDPYSFPCRPDSLKKGLESGCCNRDDICYLDGSCGMSWTNLPYIRGCTDKTWASEACPSAIDAACPWSSTFTLSKT